MIEHGSPLVVVPEYPITPSSRDFLVTIRCGYLPGGAK